MRAIRQPCTVAILLLSVWASTLVIPATAAPLDRILYSSNRGDDYDIYAVNVDGTHERLVLGGPLDQMQPEVSPDGRRIIFVQT
ncbi:MAG: TolB family protein, partial [Acidimicrobiia bacterium]